MSGLDTAFPITVGVEGNLSLDPGDRGNYTGGQVGMGVLAGTMFGVSAMSYPAMLARVPVAQQGGFPTAELIRYLTLPQAKTLYQFNEWADVSGDSLPLQIACLAFDAAVNQGEAGIKAVQAALGVEADGDIGPMTCAAANAATLPAILDEICVRRAIAYTKDSEWVSDGLGWLRRDFAVLRAVNAITPGT